MRSKGFEGMVCSVASVMEALGDRWGMLIMRDLILGLSRYEDLRKSSSVTNATLTDRLRKLESSGLIERREYQSRPIRFDYYPTAKGRDIRLVLQAMMQVGDRWNGGAANAPLSTIDLRTGRGVALALVDIETGCRVEGADIVIVAGPGADQIGRWRIDADVKSGQG